MLKVISLHFILLGVFINPSYGQTSSSYTPSEVLTGTNSNTDYLLKQDEERRMKEVFGDMKKPEKYKIPRVETEYEKSNDNRQKNSVNLNSTLEDRPEIAKDNVEKKEKSKQEIYSQSQNPSTPTKIAEPRTTHYDKSMDEFINGVYGYNPNLTLEQNKKYYNDNGYVMSYKMKDSTIYTICLGIIVLISLVFIYKGKRDSYNEKYKTEN